MAHVSEGNRQRAITQIARAISLLEDIPRQLPDDAIADREEAIKHLQAAASHLSIS